MENQSTSLRQVAWQVPMILAIAVLLALGVNQWRSEGIALVGAWSAEARFADVAGKSLVISLELAEQLFKEGRALFLDARPPDHFAEGHILGAVNLPWQEVDRYWVEMGDRLEDKSAIIAYCDGESCDLSHELALFLQMMGYENVQVLVNGWSAWVQAGLPVDGGE